MTALMKPEAFSLPLMEDEEDPFSSLLSSPDSPSSFSSPSPDSSSSSSSSSFSPSPSPRGFEQGGFPLEDYPSPSLSSPLPSSSSSSSCPPSSHLPPHPPSLDLDAYLRLDEPSLDAFLDGMAAQGPFGEEEQVQEGMQQCGGQGVEDQLMQEALSPFADPEPSGTLSSLGEGEQQHFALPWEPEAPQDLPSGGEETVSSPDSVDSRSPSPFSCGAGGLQSNPLSTKPAKFQIGKAITLEMSEEELVSLDLDQIARIAGTKFTKTEEKELKRLRRKARNKVSAAQSRQKKRDYLSGLEERVDAVTSLNIDLKKRLKELERENLLLKKNVQLLSSHLPPKVVASTLTLASPADQAPPEAPRPSASAPASRPAPAPASSAPAPSQPQSQSLLAHAHKAKAGAAATTGVYLMLLFLSFGLFFNTTASGPGALSLAGFSALFLSTPAPELASQRLVELRANLAEALLPPLSSGQGQAQAKGLFAGRRIMSEGREVPGAEFAGQDGDAGEEEDAERFLLTLSSSTGVPAVPELGANSSCDEDRFWDAYYAAEVGARSAANPDEKLRLQEEAIWSQCPDVHLDLRPLPRGEALIDRLREALPGLEEDLLQSAP